MAKAKKAEEAKKPSRTPAQDAVSAYGLDKVVEALESGRFLRDIAREIGVSLSRLQDWIDATPGRSHACARAREVAAIYWDEKAAEVLEQAQTPIEIQRARELAAHYRWRSKALSQRIYGDNRRIEAEVNLKTSVEEMSEAELLAIINKGQS